MDHAGRLGGGTDSSGWSVQRRLRPGAWSAGQLVAVLGDGAPGDVVTLLGERGGDGRVARAWLAADEFGDGGAHVVVGSEQPAQRHRGAVDEPGGTVPHRPTDRRRMHPE